MPNIARALNLRFILMIEQSFFFSSFLLVVFNNKYPKVILVLSTSFIVESNRY